MSPMPRYEYPDKVIRLLNHALEHGAVKTGFASYHWNIAPNCSNPYTVEKWGKTTTDAFHDRKGVPLVYLTIDTKCRKCTNCLRSRSNDWNRRAISEVKVAARTWFATFTIDPYHRYMVLSETRYRVPAFEMIERERQFTEQVKTVNVEITKYLKRLRKETKVPFKYLIVAEKHKDGSPHFHGLFHEISPDHPLRKEVLQRQWKFGFTSFKLVTEPSHPSICIYIHT